MKKDLMLYMQDNDEIISVLTPEQMQELKEFDAIFGNGATLEPKFEEVMFEDHPNLLDSALEEAARKFGDATDELGKCVIVVTQEMRQHLIAHGLSLKNFDVLVREDFSDKASPKDLAKELSNLVPQDSSCNISDRRKGKGERKRASRQQRKQWR